MISIRGVRESGIEESFLEEVKILMGKNGGEDGVQIKMQGILLVRTWTESMVMNTETQKLDKKLM